ncbi:MAG: transporter [Deltaproteobacteria bacterium]|nr:transporter [Deltaproteobacteria bacterium]
MRLSLLRGLFFLLITFFLGIVQQAWADQVFLTNGDRISGNLINLSPTGVQISTPHLGSFPIERQYIQTLATDNQVVVELVSGERIIGRIRPGEGATIVIQSDILGTRALALGALKAIHPLSPDEPPGIKASSNSLPDIPKAAMDKSDSPIETNLQSAQLQDFRGKGSESPSAPDKPSAKSPEETGQPKPIGQKPEDEEDIRKIFLRQTSVLLRPRQAEIEGGITYLGSQSVSTVANARIRQLQLPLTLRLGLLDRIEGFVALPIAYAQQELSFADSSTQKDKSVIGDVTAGLNFDIYQESARWPEIITTFRLRAPTGGSPQAEGLSLGSGHWAGTVGLQFIKTADPVVLFWGFQYSHEFAARHFYNDGDHDVQPGEGFGYNFGFGFAVNENVSLSAQVSGTYQSETQSDGKKISGSSSEPVSLRSALTYRLSKRGFIEPSLAIGLNDDTPNFIISLSATRRF